MWWTRQSSRLPGGSLIDNGRTNDFHCVVDLSSFHHHNLFFHAANKMAKGSGDIESSPAAPPPSLKKSNSGSQTSKNQKSILGFFQKKSTDSPPLPKNGTSLSSPMPQGVARKRLANRPAAMRSSSQALTPAPSSDAAEGLTSEDIMDEKGDQAVGENGLPSPVTPMNGTSKGNGFQGGATDLLTFNSPSRKVNLEAAGTYYALIGLF